MTISPLRLLLPREGILPRKNINGILKTPFLARRYAPSATPSKPIVLEKPAKFNPPSHPARLKKLPRHYPGPPVMPMEREARKRKRYPSMMPPKGTYYYWFLTSRNLHMWITLSTLFSVAVFTFFADFLTTTPYRDLLPPNEFFLRHPYQYVRRWLEIYRMHIDYTTAVTAEKRKRKVEDVRKRAAYRKAHGIEWEKNYFGWTAKDDDEAMGPALEIDAAAGNSPVREETEGNWEGESRPQEMV